MVTETAIWDNQRHNRNIWQYHGCYPRFRNSWYLFCGTCCKTGSKHDIAKCFMFRIKWLQKQQYVTNKDTTTTKWQYHGCSPVFVTVGIYSAVRIVNKGSKHIWYCQVSYVLELDGYRNSNMGHQKSKQKYLAISWLLPRFRNSWYLFCSTRCK